MKSDLTANLLPLLPELSLVLSCFTILLFGVCAVKRATPMLQIAGMLALAFSILLLPLSGAHPVAVMNGMFLSDGFTSLVKLFILLAALLALMLSSGWLAQEGGRPFEFVLLMLLAVAGMMLMVSANDLLALYMGLEFMSLALYVLASFNRDCARSSEAGLKYFVLGALASGMMLYGMSLLYGFTGVTDFAQFAAFFERFADEAAGNATLPPALTLGLVLLIVGMCFKVAAVPFHMWTPDVYEGAPTPVTLFFATAPKIAALAVFARVLMQPFADLVEQWQQIIIFASAASMLVGALAALRQTNIKRLLAYSSIGHAGFMLMGLAAGNADGLQGMLVYFLVYLFTTAGAFGIVLLMKREGVYVEQVADLAGLSRTRPMLALAMAAFMFSLAGIPPLAGFFGKFYVIMAAIKGGLVALAVIGLLSSVISCYYYLRVVKFMYFDEPVEGFDRDAPAPMRIALALSAAFTVLFFLAPGGVVSHARAAVEVMLY